MNQDVSILYSGGSGGFALFYYFMLSGIYKTGLKSNNIHQLIDQQFSPDLVRNPAKWKLNEQWPDNKKCKLYAKSPRLFLICNPCLQNSTAENLEITKGSIVYLLTTDIHTQIRLAWEKKAKWFVDCNADKLQNSKDATRYIRKIFKSAHNNQDPELPLIRQAFKPDYEINLQEFLRSKTVPGLPAANADQIKFLDHWLNIQPKKAKKLLLNEFKNLEK